MTDTKKFHDAMELVSELNKAHGVMMKGGKSYTEVSTRIEAFRITFGGTYGIETELVYNDQETVVVRAIIKDKDNFIANEMVGVERKNEKISPTPRPAMQLTSEDRIQAVVDFYSNGCSIAAFEKFEPKYNKTINQVGLSEEDFNRMVEAHDDRKKEIEI